MANKKTAKNAKKQGAGAIGQWITYKATAREDNPVVPSRGLKGEFTKDAYADELVANEHDANRKKDKGPPTLITFEIIELTGQHKKDFLKAADWKTLKKHHDAATPKMDAQELEFKQGVSAVASSDLLRLLKIEGENTEGLTGPETPGSDSNFSGLMLSQGKSHGSGIKSHGRGSITAWTNSAINTVFVNSTIEVDPAENWGFPNPKLVKKGDKKTRLFGAYLTKAHELNRTYYNGTGGFGQKNNAGDPESLWDQNALAHQLHIYRDPAGATGTTLLIVGFCQQDDDENAQTLEEEIRVAAMRQYWPSMVDDRNGKKTLVIKLKVTKNGQTTLNETLDPKDTYKYHIKAFQRKDNPKEKQLKAEKIGDYARRHGKNSNVCLQIPSFAGLSKRSPHSAFKHELRLTATRQKKGVQPEAENTTAIIRSRRVIKYEKIGQTAPYCGDSYFGVIEVGVMSQIGNKGKDGERFILQAEPVNHRTLDPDLLPSTQQTKIKAGYDRGARQVIKIFGDDLRNNWWKLVFHDQLNPQGDELPDHIKQLFPLTGVGKRVEQTFRTDVLQSQHNGQRWKLEGTVGLNTKTAVNLTADWKVEVSFSIVGESAGRDRLKINTKQTKIKATPAKHIINQGLNANRDGLLLTVNRNCSKVNWSIELLKPKGYTTDQFKQVKIAHTTKKG